MRYGYLVFVNKTAKTCSFASYNFNNYVYQNNKDLLLTAILNLYFILNNKKGQKI